MRQVLVSWNEDTSFDLFAGGGQIDSGEMITSSSIAAPTSMGAQVIDVTAIVSDWVGTPTTNHGWIFEPTSTNGISIVSSEGAEGSRPQLEVTFLP